MLDDVTKKRINTLRQILVGKLPDPKAQVEQITNALIYKFMNDMDEESVSMGGKATYFSGSFQKYSWKNLMNSQTSGVEKLSLYAEALNKMSDNENLPTLFRDIFKDSVLPFKDPATLNMFLKEINEFHYSNSEKLGDAFEYLLSFMGSQGDAGQFRTPRHIIDFITEIVNPKKNETILDPACGTAGFLISAYKHILKQNTKKNSGDLLNATDRKKIGKNLNGYDISPDMVKMALVNMYLHKFTNPNVNEYDTLSSEVRWNEYYDVILANPPFFSPKGGIMPHKRFSVSSTKAEVLFIDYINEHLKPAGRAGIIVPEGVIFQSGSAYIQLRKKLIETSLVGVISLPAGIFQPYSGVKTSILILDKKLNKIINKIFYYKIENDGFSLTSQRKKINFNDIGSATDSFKSFLKNTKSEDKSFQTLDKNILLKTNDYFFIYNKEEKFSKKNQTELKSLLDIAEFHRGITYKKEDETDKDGFKLLRANNVNINGSLNLNNIKIIKNKVVVKENQKLFKNDILICTASGSKEHIGKTTFIKENMEFGFGGFMGVLRTKENFNSKLLFYILHNNRFNEYLRENIYGANINNINKKILENFNLPLLSLETQNRIVEDLDGYQKIIDGCRQIVENYKTSIDVDSSWEIKEIGNFIKVQSGFAFQSKMFNEKDGFPIIRIRNIKKNFTFTKYSGEYDNNYIVKNGDLIIGMDGEFNRCIWNGGDALLNQRVCKIKVNNEINLKYLYYMIDVPLKKIENETFAITVKHISAKQITKIKIPLPEIKLQNEIVEEFDNFQKIIDGNKSLIERFQKKIDKVINEICSN